MDSDLDELVADWTLVREEVDLVAGKRGSTRLGFALQLKFYGSHGRFLQDLSELADDVVEYVARRMYDAGEHSITDLAELFSISRPTVYRTLKRTGAQ